MNHGRNKQFRRLGPAVGIIATLFAMVSAARAAEMANATVEVRVVPELRVIEGSARTPTYRYVPALRIAQGQELYYTVQVRNFGKQPVKDYVLVLPVPENTEYVANTAAGAGAEVSFSVDGGKTFARPERLHSGDGAQSAATSSYTHIRWQWSIPLAPGAMVLARFRAVFK